MAVFSSPIGAFSGTTIAVSAYQSGYGLSQLQLSPAENQASSSVTVGTTPLQFSWGSVGDIQNSGDSTTAIAFLTNSNNQANTTQFFLTGSTANNLWLYSVDIAQGASNLTAGNLSSGSKVAEFVSPPVSICYDSLASPTSANLFVALANGDICSFNVAFPTPVGSQTILSCNGYCLTVNSQGSLVLYSPYYEVLWTLAAPTLWTLTAPAMPVSSGTTGTYSVGVNTEGQLLWTLFESNTGPVVAQGVSGDTPYPNSATLAVADNGSVLMVASGTVCGTLYQGSGSYTTWVGLDGNKLTSVQQGTLTSPTITPTPNCSPLTSSVVSGSNRQIIPFCQQGQPTLYICTGQGAGGLYYFTAESFSWEPLYLPTAQSTLIYTVAAAINGTTLYVATATEIFTGVLENRSEGGWCLSNPNWSNLFIDSSEDSFSGQTITSLSFSNCTSTSNTPDTTYPQGALFIGTYGSVTSGGNEGSGSLYVYNPAGANVQVLNGGDISGAVWTLSSDGAGYVFITSGSTGLTVMNPCPTAKLETEIVLLIPNNPPTKTSWFATFLAVLSLAFAVAAAVIDPPEGGLALALTITSIECGAAGLEVTS